MINGTVFTCLSQRLAGYLMFRGERLIRLDYNRSDPYKHVFIFINSSNLENIIQEYKMLKKEN